jgi:hypothetical protein
MILTILCPFYFIQLVEVKLVGYGVEVKSTSSFFQIKCFGNEMGGSQREGAEVIGRSPVECLFYNLYLA